MPANVSQSFHGKWALVTGGSGGIGAAIATQLAAAKCNLILQGHRHKDEARKLAAMLQQEGVHVELIPCDLADSANCRTLTDQAWSIAPLDILVNCAGADVLTGDAAQGNFEQKLTALWNVDVQATILLSRAIGAKMKERGQGTVINIGWSQAEIGMAGDSGEYFSTVKAAVAAFSRSLAKSLAPSVRVNCVAPGWIQTKWGESASDYWQQRAKSESLLARWGQPDDVARVVRFLASEESAFVNGQTIHVDGGFAGSADERGWS